VWRTLQQTLSGGSCCRGALSEMYLVQQKQLHVIRQAALGSLLQPLLVRASRSSVL
jgi:hypothetical protein